MTAGTLANDININRLARWRRGYHLISSRSKGQAPAVVPIHVLDAAPVAPSLSQGAIFSNYKRPEISGQGKW